MTILQQAEELLTNMTPAEKIRLLQLIARDLGGESPGIERTPGVCGGAARVAGTRIPVWALVQYKNLGASEADLLHMYPTLKAEDLTNAWAYYRNHKEEIEIQIAENEADKGRHACTPMRISRFLWSRNFGEWVMMSLRFRKQQKPIKNFPMNWF